MTSFMQLYRDQPNPFHEGLLPYWQSHGGRRWLAAELVKSRWGWYMRYASGLDGFAIIYGRGDPRIDGTYECCIRLATEWAAKERAKRFVFVRNDYIPQQE
jgi:hypothetical protein